MAIAESFPTKAQRRSDVATAKWELDGLQRVVANARAAESRQRDEASRLGRPPEVIDLRNFPKLARTIDQGVSPSARCRANLAVALRITQPARSRASMTSPATQPVTARP
jgi:hypothetical protein